MNIAKSFNQNTSLVAHTAALTNVPFNMTDGAFALTPESLLYYCASRLGSIDAQIGKYYDDQKKMNAASKELGDIQAVLSRATSQAGGQTPEFDAKIHADEGNELLAIYRQTENPTVKEAAAQAFHLRTGLNVHEVEGQVTAAEVKGAADLGFIAPQDTAQWTGNIEKVKSAAQSLSKSAELNMIQLQSLVSQRQLAVQLTTQLMQSVHESLKQVAGNLRG
jgi:hypothetical protein